MKKKFEKDKNFDYMSVLVRSESLDIVKNYYQCFSWEIFDEHKYRCSVDTIVLEMKRPHDIKDKDKLQYLQVQMEFSLNEQAKLEATKHDGSSRFGIVFGLLCAMLFAISIYIFVKNMSLVMILMGVVLAVLGLILNFLIIFLINDMHKKETEYFNKRTEYIFENIDKICEKVKSDKN